MTTPQAPPGHGRPAASSSTEGEDEGETHYDRALKGSGCQTEHFTLLVRSGDQSKQAIGPICWAGAGLKLG